MEKVPPEKKQHNYSYNRNGQLVGTYNPDGSLRARYEYLTQGHSPVYMVLGNITYRLIKDQLGSIRLVMNTTTGAIAQRLDYDEYGVVTADTNPGFQVFGYAGGLYDSDTKLIRFGARDYDAEIGRWTSKDPIRFAGGDTNLYAYVGGDPVSYTDSTGLATDVICRPVGGSGGSAGGVHCFLRITPEAGSTLGSNPITLSLLTPDMNVGNKYVNANADSGSGTFRAAVDNGQCNTPGAQDKIDRGIMDSFNRQPNGTPYSAIPYGGASNSNAFIRRVLQGAGLSVIPSAPFGAVGY